MHLVLRIIEVDISEACICMVQSKYGERLHSSLCNIVEWNTWETFRIYLFHQIM